MKSLHYSACLIVFLVMLSACANNVESVVQAQDTPFDWRKDWSIEEGFALEIDSEGYDFPTAIAFVPNPGPNPDDPLYFVTELMGKVKVVTNDRTVHTFADNIFDLNPKGELPSGQGQVGLAGLCLDPRQGYVFITFPYHDVKGILRNNIIRFETGSETFALAPTGQTPFTDIFLPYESGLAHHIGPCQVSDDVLYVGIGEAWQAHLTTDLNAMNGKIIRMTLDGQPLPENPFYEDGAIDRAVNYVWAYGFRNPFGMKVIDDRVIVADNGQKIDRFLEAEEGVDYLWNGNDRTIAANAAYVFVPSLAPVQMDSYPPDADFFPLPYQDQFYLALYQLAPEQGKIPGVMRINYGLNEKRILSMPTNFVKYRGSQDYQAVTGLAFGPDGLYFSTLVPNQEGRTFILKATYDPDKAHPYSTVQNNDPRALFVEKGCAGCHSKDGQWGYGGTAGPVLDRDALVERLDARLNNDAYVASLVEIDKLDTEPHAGYKAARQEVAAADGLERVKTWVTYRIQEPRFDNQYSTMPSLDVSEREAAILADFLLAEEKQRASGLRSLLPRTIRTRHLAIFFAAGFVAACGLWVVGLGGKALLGRRKDKKQLQAPENAEV